MRKIVTLLILIFTYVTTFAQMDKDGNFHWDELYKPSEILELDASLPNTVDVAKIPNRENVKYIKLKRYPWIESIPFTPEDFPNLEALRIESLLIQGLNGIDGFKKIKRFEVTDIEGHKSVRNLLCTKLPCVSNPIWKMTWLEELKIKGLDILVTENTISNLCNVKYLNISGFSIFYGGAFLEEFNKLSSLKQIYFGQDDASLTLYLAKTFSEKGIEVIGTFNIDQINSMIVQKNGKDYYRDTIEWDEIIRYRPWGVSLRPSIRVYDNTENDITMYVKKQKGKVVFIKSQWKEYGYQKRTDYYNYNYLTDKENIKKSLPNIKQLEKNREDVVIYYYNFSNVVKNDTPHVECLRFSPLFESREEYGLYVFADTMTYFYNDEMPDSDYSDPKAYAEWGCLVFYSPLKRKSVRLETGCVNFAVFDYKKNMLWERGCSACGDYIIIHNNELLGDYRRDPDCGYPWDCMEDGSEYFVNMKRSNSSDDKTNLRSFYNNVETFRANLKRELGPFAKYLEYRQSRGLLNLLDLKERNNYGYDD